MVRSRERQHNSVLRYPRKSRRIRSNLKKNTQYYRRRSFIRRLVNNPLRYYMYEKLRNYPHSYAKHYDIGPRTVRKENFTFSVKPLPTLNQTPAGSKLARHSLNLEDEDDDLNVTIPYLKTLLKKKIYKSREVTPVQNFDTPSKTRGNKVFRRIGTHSSVYRKK